MYKINASERLLLDCVRANSDEALSESLKRLLEASESPEMQLVLREGLKTFLPIYLSANNNLPESILPEAIKDRIKIKYVANVANNAKIRTEAIELAKVFNEASIDLIFLKGAAHLFTIYKDDIGLREMVDIDVLVRKDDLEKACYILMNMGYQKTADKENFSKQHFHYGYSNGQVKVELHRQIGFHTDLLVLNKLFILSDKIQVENEGIKILSPEAQVFMAYAHFVKHFNLIYPPILYRSAGGAGIIFYNALFLFLEIKKILRYYNGEFSWEVFLSLVNSVSKNSDCLDTIIFLSKYIANIEIADNILRRIRRARWGQSYLHLCHKSQYNQVVNLIFINVIISMLRFEEGILRAPPRALRVFYFLILESLPLKALLFLRAFYRNSGLCSLWMKIRVRLEETIIQPQK